MARSIVRAVGLAVAVLVTLGPLPARAGYDRSFPEGSLVVPMDLAYQDSGLLQAYGLVFQLLRQGVTVYWVIDPDKTWHAADCDAAGDECAWDCAEEGSGVKCSYPTASPDFFVGAAVLWSDGTADGDTVARHGYRGGPFVVDAADAAAARAIVDAWNDSSLWDDAPWASRPDPQVVTVHQTTGAFDGYVAKEMVAAPTIAVFSDGNEDIATGYLRAAGIAQSNGLPFPDAKCGAANCGPGTDNPDMLTVVSIMGDMGTCDAPNRDHRNGALFTPEGTPAYCQIMSMHWNVNDRETVECDGGGCPATQDACAGETFTYHGHEVVAEVRQFLSFPTHFFAECQAVNAYENTVPNPAWPYLDDDERRGHFLTTQGIPPDCPCTDGDFECVAGGCDDGARDCCLPKDAKEVGAGFLIAAQPDSNTLQVLNPHVAYNQLDGAFGTTGGSEPAYNLSDYLGTAYKNDLEVTFITGPDGPGDQDVWMTGYMDGECDILTYDEFARPGECSLGKVSYLGGHRYATDVPISRNTGSQGTRLFLNALFEADCVTTAGQPALGLSWSGATVVSAAALPADEDYTVSFANTGPAGALDAVLTVTVPAGVSITAAADGGVVAGDTATWEIGTLGAMGSTAPPAGGSRSLTLRIAEAATHELSATLRYRVGVSEKVVGPVPYTVMVGEDRDGDGVIDADDPAPDDASRCGDSDADTCDDCAVAGTRSPANDGPDADGDGICDAGAAGSDAGPDAGGGDGSGGGGCGCRAPGGRGAPAGAGLGLLALLGIAAARRRRER